MMKTMKMKGFDFGQIPSCDVVRHKQDIDIYIIM